MVDQLNYNGVEFSVSVKDYSKIEAQNSVNIVFGYENKEFYPIYVSRQNNEDILNLMKIPVIFHNLRGYDSYFIMQEIGDTGKGNNMHINCIPNNMERYMAFM